MKLIWIFLIFALSTIDCKKNQRGILILGWLGYQCETVRQMHKNDYTLTKKTKVLKNNPCQGGIISLWDHQSFILRGLITQNRKQTSEIPFNQDQIIKNTKLYHQLLAYSPTLELFESQNYKLWQKIWRLNKQSNLDEIHSKKYKQKINKQTPTQFLKKAIKIYKLVNPKKIPWGQFNREGLAYYLNISKHSILFNCDSQGNIDKIAVCFTFSGQKLKISKCQGKNLLFQCQSNPERMVLKRWKIVGRNIDVFDRETSKILQQLKHSFLTIVDKNLVNIGLIMIPLVILIIHRHLKDPKTENKRGNHQLSRNPNK